MIEQKISYSQYKIWKDCHYMWQLRYVDKLGKFEDSIHNIFGTAMHEVVQEWLEQYLYGEKPGIAKYVDLSDNLKARMKELSAPVIRQIDEDGNEYFLFSRQDMEDFYHQGVEILRYIQKNVDNFFPTKNHVLWGIESEINYPVREKIYFRGFIDIVIFDRETETFHLYDLKTSTRGWNKYAKADKSKTDQLLLYKNYFSKQHDIPIDKVEVNYVIMKRILPEGTDYPVPRVSNFVPAQKKISINKAVKGIEHFVEVAFDDENNYISGQKAMPSDFSCRFCPFSENGVCEHSVKLKKNVKKKEDEEEWVTLK